MDFKSTLDQRNAQVALELATEARLRFHGGLEEAMGSAARGLRGIHGKIGALQELEQIRPVARGDRDADAGVAAEAMAVTIERRSQRLINLRNQCADVVIAIDIALHDGEFITAETGDEIANSDAIAQVV